MHEPVTRHEYDMPGEGTPCPWKVVHHQPHRGPSTYKSERRTTTVIFTRVEVTAGSGLAPKSEEPLRHCSKLRRRQRRYTKMKASLLFLIVLVGCAVAYPRTYNRRYIREFGLPRCAEGFDQLIAFEYSTESARLQQQRAGFIRARRAPIHRAMLIHGFYRPYRPLAQRRQGFEPETSMTAFAAGDSVAAGSYLGSKFGPNCVSCDPQADQENTEFVGAPEADPAQFESEKPIGDYPEAPVGLIPVADAEEADEPVRPLRPTSSQKRKPNKIADDDEADDEQDTFALKKSKGSNSYFPIVFGGYPGVRSAGGSGGGGVTAIANSYSTGKGGVATSHATAYGGAPPKKGRKGQVPQEDDDE